MRILWITLGLMAPNMSFGWGEVCPEDVTVSQLNTQMESVESMLTEGILNASRDTLSEVHKHLLCVDSVVSAPFMSRLSTLFAITFFFDQDDDASQRWMRSSQYAVETITWPEVINATHPLRELETDLEWLVLTQEDTGFQLPKKSALFMSGRFVAKPTAPLETPLLVQIADKKGRVLSSWWQDGTAFPKEWLIAGAPPTPAPSWREQVSTGRSTKTAAKQPVTRVEKNTQTTPAAQSRTLSEPATPATKTLLAAPEAKTSHAVEMEAVPTQYVDPFQEARTRRVLRERSERTIEGEQGARTIVRTEIVSFLPDPSEGRPVTHQHFEQWLKDTPEWHKDAAIARGEADENYLKDWEGTRHPEGARKTPVIWLPFAAAQAYCTSFGNQLEADVFQAVDAYEWEWRLRGEQMVRVSSKGKLKREMDDSASYASVGFRCKK